MEDRHAIEKMLRCKVLRAGGIVFALCLVVLGVYFYKFHGVLSDKAETWGAFGDFVGGVCSLFLAAMNIWIFYVLTKTIAIQESIREQNRQKFEQLRQKVMMQTEELQDFCTIVNELFSHINHDDGMCRICNIDSFPDLVHQLEHKKGSAVFEIYQSGMYANTCKQLSGLYAALIDGDYDWKDDTYEERCYRKYTMLKEIERSLHQEHKIAIGQIMGA